ncbi:hypothetical protein HMPREF0373_02399 [Eubacterium ramulus ATCC 29099]|uniref:Uncharacterized protein n=1 Tax=Eubacterium ramulus ATCC 29099 TaxID=1256908 RepID=U2PIJ4_EUBRA|nr:hypothetical protein HMPREF0373_02399 [Eubacterium ramulus ATCC 29099]
MLFYYTISNCFILPRNMKRHGLKKMGFTITHANSKLLLG